MLKPLLWDASQAVVCTIPSFLPVCSALCMYGRSLGGQYVDLSWHLKDEQNSLLTCLEELQHLSRQYMLFCQG